MKILGIETSCDETAASVLSDGRVLSNIVSSQLDLHRKYGGVVPEIASRRHIEVILHVIKEALDLAGITTDDLDAIAVTKGPGLIGSLLVGLSVAKAMAFARGIPLIGVDHLEGHLYAIFLETNPPFPYVGLVVSGGHTNLYLVKDFCNYQLLGKTRDDAAGEVFDKLAKLLDLGYPGGAIINKISLNGDPTRIPFPRAQLSTEFDFSFSGVKTAASYLLKSLSPNERAVMIPHIAASYQEAIVDMLVDKTFRAAEKMRVSAIVVSGGVAANTRLREKFMEDAKTKGISIYFPSPDLCTDNGAMIAYAGWKRLQRGDRSPMSLNAYSRKDLMRIS